MKNRVFALLVLLLISGHVNALNVAITAQASGGDRPTISGTTNLPDGIELMVTISRKESNYMAQDKVKVKGGVFQTTQFTQKGAAFNPGKYTIEIMMPVAGVQPPQTWPIIGNDGSKLEGPLVKKSSFGGKIVEYKTSTQVGVGKASLDQDRKAREQEKKDKHEWWLRSCTDTCKLAQGMAQRQGKTFDWDRCYYKCVADEPTTK